jgi:hypothetical protein
MWMLIWQELQKHSGQMGMATPHLRDPYQSIMRDAHVFHYHRSIDEFSIKFDKIATRIKATITKAEYTQFFGFLQFIIRHKLCPDHLRRAIDNTLVDCRAAYRVVDRTIMPLASPEELSAVKQALEDVRLQPYHGARSNLRKSGEALTEGRFADSVRESIHAVESLARSITGKDKLSDALSELERGAKMHKAMKRGFDGLYGWTSDEQGIRHPLLDEGDTKVTEADAMFMLGACASFVSLLIDKGRVAGLVKG